MDRFGWCRSVVAAWTVLVGAVCAHGAVGDWIVMDLRDGRTIEGKVVEETDHKIVIDYYGAGVPVQWTFAKSDIRKVTVKPAEERPAKTPELPGAKPSSPTSDDGADQKGGYAVVPARGSIGHQLSTHFFAEAIDEARDQGAEVVVFHLESPGGYVQTLKEIRETIDKEARGVEVAFFVDGQCFSAAALLCMSNEHFYVGTGAALGAAVHIKGNASGGVDPVEAKYMAAEASIWRGYAEKHGRPGLLTDAMIMQDVEVWADKSVEPWALYRQRPSGGGDLIDSDTSILALTHDEAIGVDAADGSARSATAVGKRLSKVDRVAFDGARLADRIHNKQERMISQIVSRFSTAEREDAELLKKIEDGELTLAQAKSFCRKRMGLLRAIKRDVESAEYLSFYLASTEGITAAHLDEWIGVWQQRLDNLKDLD